MAEEARELSEGSYKDTDPNTRAWLSYPNHLPKTIPLITIMLGVRISTYKFGERGEETNIQLLTHPYHNS